MQPATEDPSSLPEPWWVPDRSHLRVLEDECRVELSPGHVLYGCEIAAVARREDRDDVLFRVTGRPYRWALVHLTCVRRREQPPWPMTRTYESLSALPADG